MSKVYMHYRRRNFVIALMEQEQMLPMSKYALARRHALANDVRKLGSNFNLVKIFFFFDYYRVIVPLPPLLGSFVPSIWILSNRFFLQASSSDFQ